MEEKNKPMHIHIEIRDIIIIVSMAVSLLFQYFIMYKEHEIRIVILETQMNSLTSTLNEVRTDVKSLLEHSTGRR